MSLTAGWGVTQRSRAAVAYQFWMESMVSTQPEFRRRWARLALAVPLLAAGGAMSAAPWLGGQQAAAGAAADVARDIALERRVKAAFLYKFLGYAEFPSQAFEDAAAPLTIGVVGADDMAAELARIAAGRSVDGRPVVVRAVREQDAGQPLHLLFVACSSVAHSARVLRSAPALLTVTECDDGPVAGSVINFTIVDERVRFDVSLDAAEKKNVKLSSRLLTVANRVQKGTT